MLATALGQGRVRVKLDQETIFVHPPVSTDDALLDAEDPLVRGSVVLSLSRRRQVRSVHVELEGICDAQGGASCSYETSQTLMQRLRLDLGEEYFDAGDHTFRFSFIVPSSTAVHHGSSFGRVRHYVKATVKLSAMGRLKLSSPCVLLNVCASPARHGDLPAPLDVKIQHFDPDIGDLAGNIVSPHLTSGSLIQVNLSFVTPAKRIEIEDIKTIIKESFAVHYSLTKVVTPPPIQHTLHLLPSEVSISGSDPASIPSSQPVLENSSLSSFPFPPIRSSTNRPAESRRRTPPISIALEPNQGSKVAFVVRLPASNTIKPTTLEGTKTKIRVHHTLAVEVRYRVWEGGSEAGSAGAWGEDLALCIGTDIVVASCCCAQNTASLPGYEESTTASLPGYEDSKFVGKSTPPPSFDSILDGDVSPPLATPDLPRPLRRATEGLCLCSTTLAEFHYRNVVDTSHIPVGAGREGIRVLSDAVAREATERIRTWRAEKSPASLQYS